MFSLGDQPFANAYWSVAQRGKPEPTAPLILCECADCGMVQLKHVVDPVGLFAEYAFVTGSSRRMAEHFAALMREGIARYVPANGLVVEIGSNDGTALASIPNDGRCRRLGVDPAANLCEIAHSRNVPYIVGFFSEDLAERIVESHGLASLIVACNVIGHVDDLDDVCRGVKTLLAPDGACVIEVPLASWLMARTEFDTVYHEHLSYFGVSPLARLFGRHGLRIVRLVTQDVHGGSVRLTIRHGDGHTGAIDSWIEGESRGRDWRALTSRCEEAAQHLVEWLARARDEGRSVIGYGAPAKATVRLNYCGVGTDLLPMVVDSTPTKIGRVIPGTHQPICDPSEIDSRAPSDVLILAWNHEAEIRGKLGAYIGRGGRVSSVRDVSAGIWR